MSTQPSVVESICRLPVDFRNQSKSPLQIVQESGFLENPDSLNRADVERYLRTAPELIDAWLSWSEDKRVSSGWYFVKDVSGYIVGYYPDGERLRYFNKRRACAEFILREARGFYELPASE